MAGTGVLNAKEKNQITFGGLGYVGSLHKLGHRFGGIALDSSRNTYIRLTAITAENRIGTFSGSSSGSGVTLTSSVTKALGVYADDGGAAIGSGTFARAIVGRHLLTYTSANREQEAAGVVGQVVSVAGTNRHNMCGVMGSYEVRTSLTVDGQAWATDPWIQAAVIGRVGCGTSITTVNSNAVLAGVAAMSNTVSFSANSGTFTGFFVGKWSGTVDWAYGLVVDLAAVSVAGIYMPGGTAMKGIRLGTLSSDTAGSGLTVDATITRAVEVHVDDNDTARAVGTQGRAIFGRTMIYANNACEDWGVDGLSKVSGVAKTGNVSAGVVGRFESTGTCSTATGSGNCFVTGVMGRLGGGGSFTLGAGTYACGVLSFYNTSTTNDFTGARTVAYMATASDIAGTGDWDYGMYLEDCVRGYYITANLGTMDGEMHGESLALTGTLTSGDSMVGKNIVVTTGGTAGLWVSGLYAKVTQGSTKNVNGYISAAELEVTNTADNVSDWFVLVLNASNSGAQQGTHASYIALRDYGSTDIQSFLWVSTDHTITGNNTALISNVGSAQTHTHSLRIIVGSTPYWIMLTNAWA